jgi:hypothetical protein
MGDDAKREGRGRCWDQVAVIVMEIKQDFE